MPDNTFLLVGLGLAAWALLRNNQQQNGETDLVNASMLSQGTGREGKPLDLIPVVSSETPINLAESTQRIPVANGGAAGFDFMAWLNNIGIKTPPVGKTNTSASQKVVNEDLPNEKTGPEAPVTVSPFVQTPEYIRQNYELAGTAVRQLGLTRGVDLLNDKIYVQAIEVDEDSTIPRIEGPVTLGEDVQIVAGGANPGDPYFTSLDTLMAAKDEGFFSAAPAYIPRTWQEIETDWDITHGLPDRHAAPPPIQEMVTVTGGVPLEVSRSPWDLTTRPWDRTHYDMDTETEF